MTSVAFGDMSFTPTAQIELKIAMDPKINHELGWLETADIPITMKVNMGARNASARRRMRTRRVSKRFRYRSLSDISATVCLATLEHLNEERL